MLRTFDNYLMYLMIISPAKAVSKPNLGACEGGDTDKVEIQLPEGGITFNAFFDFSTFFLVVCLFWKLPSGYIVSHLHKSLFQRDVSRSLFSNVLGSRDAQCSVAVNSVLVNRRVIFTPRRLNCKQRKCLLELYFDLFLKNT